MSTSDTNKKLNRFALKTAYIYLLISIAVACFGLIYEEYSHGVYSRYMIYAFIFPLFFGAFPFFTAALFPIKYPGTYVRMFYHPAIATFTVGFILKGALNIYGISNKLIYVYWIAGICLILVSMFLYFISFFINDKNKLNK